MKKKFIANLAFLIGLNLLIKPFWIFGIDRSVQNIVGADQYGLYYALLNFSFLFNILLDLGITNYNNRNIAQNEQLLTKHLSGIIMLRIFLSVVFFIIAITVAYMFGYDASALKFLLILLLNQVLLSFILYFRSNLSALQLFKTDSIISILDKSIMILICSILLWTNLTKQPFQLEWFVWAQTFAYLISALIAFAILLNKAERLTLFWSLPFFIMILKQSYPYAILVLLMTFSYRIDSIMLERLLPDGALQAGIYAQAYRLMDASAIIAFLFAGLLLPMYARMLKQKENVEELTKLSFSLIMVPAVLIASCSFSYSDKIMNLLYHQHAEQSAEILGIVMFSFISLSSSFVFGTLLTANGSLKYLNYTALGGMLLNVTLNLVLIPLYKVTGAAIACLITQTSTALAQILITGKVFSWHINIRFIIRFFIYLTCCIFVCYAFRISSINWLLSMVFSAFSGILLAFVLRLIKWKDIFIFKIGPV